MSTLTTLADLSDEELAVHLACGLSALCEMTATNPDAAALCTQPEGRAEVRTTIGDLIAETFGRYHVEMVDECTPVSAMAH